MPISMLHLLCPVPPVSTPPPQCPRTAIIQPGACMPTCMHTCILAPSRFGTARPLQGQSTPAGMQPGRDFLAAAANDAGATVTDEFMRCQGADCRMTMHGDAPSRGFWVSIVFKAASDGSGGALDYRNPAYPHLVFVMRFPGPTIVVMDRVAAGMDSEWEHGCDGDAVPTGHHCLSTLLELVGARLPQVCASRRVQHPINCTSPPLPPPSLSSAVGGGPWCRMHQLPLLSRTRATCTALFRSPRRW